MILWLLFIALEVGRNYYIIEVKKIRPDYLKSFILRGMAAVLHGVFMDLRTGIFGRAWELSSWELLLVWLPLLAFQVCSFWVLFDLGLNLSRKYLAKREIHPLYYNKSGWIEKTVGKSEFAYYLLKLIALCIFIWLWI